MRTLHAAFSTAAGATFGKPLILLSLDGLATPIYITSGADSLSFDSKTFRAHQHSIEGAIGPELDWRGGLSADEDFTVSIIQARYGTGGLSGASSWYNSFDELLKTFAFDQFDATNNKVESSWIDVSGASACTVWFVWNDGSPITSEAIKVHVGAVKNVAMDDYGTLKLTIGSLRRGFLNRKFINRLGAESSGDENYDTGRDYVEGNDKEPIPLLYGQPNYAAGLTIHDTASKDDAVRSGLVLCFSDVRFDCESDNAAAADLRVYDSGLQNMSRVLRDSFETSDTRQYDFCGFDTHAHCPEAVFYSGGRFVNFHDTFFVGAYRDRLAGAGFLLIERGPFLLTSLNYTYCYGTLNDEENACDGDDTTYADLRGYDGGGQAAQRGLGWNIPIVNYSGHVYRLFFQCKYAWNATTGEYTTTKVQLIGASTSEYGQGATTWDETGDPNDWDNWTGADEAWIIGKAADATNTPPIWEMGLLASDSNLAMLYLSDPGAANNADYPLSWDIYGARMYVVQEIGWGDFLNKIVAYQAKGIIDSTHHGASASTALVAPCDIFSHFIEEVLSEASRVDTTAKAAAYTDCSGHTLGFQLTDPEETAESVLDRIAMQSMSWIVTGGDGLEKFIYRPGLELDPDDAEDPITESDILKGSFKMYLTAESDLYAGVIVNYDFNPASNKFDGQYRILPTGHHLSTNVSSPNDYVGLADMVSEQTDQILEVDADMISADTPAEDLTKWLMQQHCRRRQIIEFDLWPEQMKWEAGDVMPVVHPMIRPYSSGTYLDLNNLTNVCTKTSGYTYHWPTVGTAYQMAEHPNDLLVIPGTVTENAGR